MCPPESTLLKFHQGHKLTFSFICRANTAFKRLTQACRVISVNILTQLMNFALLFDPPSAERSFHWGFRKDHRAFLATWWLHGPVILLAESRRVWPLLKEEVIFFPKVGATVDVLVWTHQVRRLHNSTVRVRFGQYILELCFYLSSVIMWFLTVKLCQSICSQ